MSDDAVELDTRSASESVTLTIEGLRAGVVLSASKISGDGYESITKDPALMKVDDRHARLTITRATPTELEPGDHRGRIRVRGCVGDSCEDALIAVRYHVVRLLLDEKVLTRRQPVGATREEVAEVRLSTSDGSDSDWTASISFGTDPVGGWLAVPEHGASVDDAVRLTFSPPEKPGRYAAWVRFESDAGSATLEVHLEIVRELVSDTAQVDFTARVGETPQARTISLTDGGGASYRWEAFFMQTNRFDDPCAVYDWLKFSPRSGAQLPVAIKLEPVPMRVADACTGTLEIMVDGITIQALPITYQVAD